MARAEKLSLGLVLALSACRREPAGHREPDAKPAVSAGVAARLLDIENRRVLGGVTEEDIANSDRAARRLAARALARIGTTRSVPLLQKALSDEDGEVIAWAAHGLSYVCRTEGVNGAEIVRALATRAATLPNNSGGALDAMFSITRGLGRCATEEAERTLVGWLGLPAPRAGYAALALGDIASRRKELADATFTALLRAAAPGDAGEPLGEALYPFGRLEQPPAKFADSLHAAAVAALRRPGANRLFAIRALSRVGHGASDLARVLTSADAFTSVERSEAARGLGRSRGEAEQKALLDAIPTLAPPRDPVAATALGTEAFGPLIVALEALRAPLKTSGGEKVLYDLARWPVPKDAPPTLVRRVVRLRCRAANLLVNGVADDPLLAQCDPDADGVTGQRATLDVVGRRSFDPKRAAMFRKFAASPHPRVREAAIEMLAGHPEFEETASVIEAALAAKEVGIVATAAEFIAAHPERVMMGPRGCIDAKGAPCEPGSPRDIAARSDAGAHAATANNASALRGTPARDGGDRGGASRGGVLGGVAEKLKAAIERQWAPDDLETLGTLVEAAGAVRLTGMTDKLEALCQHDNPTMRDHAARALSLLREPRTVCPSPESAAQGAPELLHLVNSPVKIRLRTDAGDLTLKLDPTHAPVAVTRVADLVRDGFYDGIVVHRVVPGFVVQFGDPGGDGFGGPGRAPLRCETTPAPYGEFDIGVALAGRDTGSSQLFVTLARYPNLDQEYALIGKAEGNWNAVTEGDVIRDATVVP
jgi:cyclophilin family peptidyl-prolyl cis-trans isomerase